MASGTSDARTAHFVERKSHPRSTRFVGLLVLGCACFLPATTLAQPKNNEANLEPSERVGETPGVESQADRILREMGEYLRAAGEFTFHADVTYDSVLPNGQKIQYGGTSDVSVRRPDRLRADYNGDQRQSQAIYDGQTITLYDMAVNVYAVAAVPPEIDAAVDQIFDSYGFSVPIADLVYSDPYRVLTEYVESGFWVGRHSVDGTPCHQLAFSQDSIDWQIWIEDGPRPVPRKIVITYKQEPGSPQYTARLSAWDFQPRLSDHYFRFHPPVGADEIEFLPSRTDLPTEESEAKP